MPDADKTSPVDPLDQETVTVVQGGGDDAETKRVGGAGDFSPEGRDPRGGADPKPHGYAHRKTIDIIEDIRSFLPILEEAGFKLNRLQIEVGLSPKIITLFETTPDASPERGRELLGEVKSSRLMRAMLEGLVKAAALQQHVHLPGMDFAGVEVAVGPIPSVRLVFNAR